MSRPALCLRCGLAFALKRGQCRKCYPKSNREVQAGVATWAGMEALGLALPGTTRAERNRAWWERRGVHV